MEILIQITIILAGIITCIALSVRFGNKVSDRSGANIAEKYFKEEWGMDEKKEYHE